LTGSAALVLAVAFAAAVGASQPAGQVGSRPKSNLDYWLRQAGSATTQALPQAPATNPFGRRDRFRRGDALPGVVVLSDGRTIPGGIYTTRDKNWEEWVESAKRWRHIHPILVLSISADVIEKGMEKEWRWKEMGSDEKVYTGREKPIRRFLWRFHLIDDSYVTGAVKGQPVWVEAQGRKRGPFILHERSAGKHGQTLKDLVYLKKLVISRRAMQHTRNRERGTGNQERRTRNQDQGTRNRENRTPAPQNNRTGSVFPAPGS